MFSFGEMDRRHVANLETLRRDLEARRVDGKQAADLVEGTILPEIRAARTRSAGLLQARQRKLADALTLDKYGRAKDWQHLAEFRLELARANAWASYLGEHEAAWQLQARSLRENDRTLANEATRREAAAVQAFTAVLNKRR
jgi:hypothetical protein